MANNEFKKLQSQVKESVEKYNEIRTKCNIQRPWHKETIMSLANPFLQGHFTLAVAGKMSSGKSTFINALTGMNILPTGHFQTTSTITYIEDSNKTALEITYCDGIVTKVDLGIKEISTRLKELVAVPDKYSKLPINDINRLISGGDDISEILKKKEGIEKSTQCIHTSDDVWKEYVNEHPRNTIVKKVKVLCPLPNEFQGWMIVDTPGIGAIGGIQDETKKLFASGDDKGNKNVDAIIFLQSGTDNIEDESTVKFIRDTFDQLTDNAKKRLFFILTKAASSDFRNNKEEILTKAKELYAKPYDIPEERITFVDSLLGKFRHDLTDKENFDDIEELEGWDSKSLETMADLYNPIKRAIKKKSLEMCNETIDEEMAELSNLDNVKEEINLFVKKEKSATVNRIRSLIKRDCSGFMRFFQKQITLLRGGKPELEKEKKALKEKKTRTSLFLNDLSRRFSLSEAIKKFEYFDSDLKEVGNKKTIGEIRTAYQNLIDKTTATEEGIFNELKTVLKDYCDSKEETDVVLRSIDFDYLEEMAEKESTSDVVDRSRPVRKLVREGGFSSDDEYRTTYPYTKKEIDFEKKRRDFAAYVLKAARSAREAFYKNFDQKFNTFISEAKSNIDNELKSYGDSLDATERQLNKKDEKIKEYEQKIAIINENC